MWQSLPELGTGIVYAILIAAAYTFAVALAAGRGRPRLLQAARLGAYSTSALVLFAVLLLSYAFVSHDFRIRYVAHYSDRRMSTAYLLTALWGGQDGSLLWWSLLLSGYVAACVAWLKGRYRELQPYVIATLMVIVSFFAIIMLFAANPFETSIAGARPDGEGLNPLLQNYWMIIHPPSLYMGFVGCSVPFAFCVAALVTRRLDNEWVIAVRKWMLFAFLFLSIGNVLGMRWAYEELGWGGYWAWDPVENAACLPWFTAAAYVHSTMIQERRPMLRVWNVFLICLTFFLTIFGTFLTRAGIITSVHSFAQSSIGTYFVYFMGVILGASLGLMVWRLPELKSKGQIEAVASREAMFVANNWALLGGMTFILVSTMYPKISELWGESATVGPPHFNRWMGPIGLVIFALMGLAPLFGWRKTSENAIKKAFRAPLIAMGVTVALHLALGNYLGYPFLVARDAFYPGVVGVLLQKVGSTLPGITIALCGFNVAVIVQEFVRGVKARRAAADKRGEPEPVFSSLFRLVEKNRRRYGGYIVHLGIVSMFIGFTGTAWNIDRETALVPGNHYKIGEYDLTYEGSRRCPGNPKCSPEEQADIEKMMIFADLKVTRAGKEMGYVHPAKFIYQSSPDGPTTEVAMMSTLHEDLYTVVGQIDPQSKRATFQLHVNPLVAWIWLGLLILMSGCIVSLFPELSFAEAGAWSYLRAGAGVAAGTGFAVWMAMAPSTAYNTHERPRKPDAGAPTAALGSLKQLPTSGLGTAGFVGLALGAVVSLGRRRKEDANSPRD